jgi:hypothetical protein
MSLSAKIYKAYKKGFFERHNDVRGAVKLHDALKGFAQRSLEKPDKEPEGIFDKDDWDNLIIIDACRHDLYEEVEGETTKRTAIGGHSREFLEKTFSEGDFSDIVYVSANFHTDPTLFERATGRKPEEVFHTVYQTHDTDWGEDNIVPPEAVVRDTLSAHKLFPDKKLIVHFMQPHHPFHSLDISSYEETSIWKLAERGEFDDETIWKHYRKNLEFVMPYVKELAGDLEGRTFLTSDHGNLVGENSLYHHPYGASSKPVREVPWTEL